MKLTDIAEIVAAQVPLCPLPLVMHYTRIAVDDFLTRTRAWEAELDGEWNNTHPTVHVCCPEDAKLAYVYRVRVGDRELPHYAGDSSLWRRRDRVSPDGPTFWRFINGELQLWPVMKKYEEPGPIFKVGALVALTIEQRAMCVPDWLDIDDVSYGALSKLYGMVGQTWSDPNLSLLFAGKFDEAIASKRIERVHGGKPGSLTIKTPRVGGYF